MIKNIKQNGFTLVEVIVVITILAAAAAVAIPSLLNYQQKADQMTRDKNARTVFLAAQNALTTSYTSGRIGQLSQGNGMVDIGTITPALEGTTEEKNTPNIVYLYLDKNTTDKESNQLYQLLEPYLNDKGIFDQALLIEYNKLTGKMLSAFYSDEVSRLRYTGIESGKDDTFTVNRRSAGWLQENKVGYCAVDKTGNLTVTEPTEEPEADDTTPVMLVDYVGGEKQEGNEINEGKNYGLLTLECQLPETLSDLKDYNYIIKFNLNSNEIYDLTLPSESVTADSLQAALSSPVKAAYTKNQQGESNYAELPVYIDKNKNNGKKVLVIVLDSVVDESGKYSEVYNIARPATRPTRKTIKIPSDGELTASFAIEDSGKNIIQPENTSNKVNSYFGGDEAEAGQYVYKIASVRHLNHIRDNKTQINTAADRYQYEQTQDVLVRSYMADAGHSGVIDFPPLWNVYDYNYGGMASSKGLNEMFQGNYDGMGHGIYDLTMTDNEREYSGLFTIVDKGCSVKNLTIAYTKAYKESADGNERSAYIHGQKNAGGIASYNEGTISRCSVEGNIYGDSSNGAYAGGIVGNNSNTIKDCFVGANVFGGYCAGGIVGKDEKSGIDGSTEDGQIRRCEIGSASVSLIEAKANGDYKQVVGVPQFGNVGSREPNYRENYSNDAFTIQAQYAAGGVLGIGELTEVTSCLNAAEIKSTASYGVAGGIAGNGGLQFKVINSYNAGTIEGSTYAGGIVGNADNVIKTCYNTGEIKSGNYRGGILGYSSRDKLPTDCYTLSRVQVEGAGVNNGRVLTESDTDVVIDGMTQNSEKPFDFTYPQIPSNPHRTPWK